MAVFGPLFRIPRRRMAGKRLVIGVMCTVCLLLGVYIKFFNHESSDKLLLANRQGVQGDDVVIVAKPNFHRIGANKKKEVLSDKEVEAHVKRVNTQNFIETADEGDTIQKDGNDKSGLNEARHEAIEEKEDEWADDDHEINDFHNQDHEPEHDEVNQQPVDINKPVERVEGEDEEEDDELRDAGGDGGEREEEDDNDEDGEEDEEHFKGRGPHDIKLFDWDQWVKDNQFVELGNVWGYCDDDNPPVIGKLLLLEDEEKGGVKNIFIFNTTFDEDVLMGKVEISIDFNDVHFYTNTFDLEDLETEGDFFKTPIKKGDQYYVREQHISSFVPKGRYYGEAKMTDQNDRVLICATINLNMK